jgi:hypothetical protein
MPRGGAGDGETRVAGSVAGASNYSAINNPRVTRVIGPLSARPPRRSPARLPSFLATNQPSATPLEGINARGTSTRLLCRDVSAAFIAPRSVCRSIARPGPLMKRDDCLPTVRLRDTRDNRQ